MAAPYQERPLPAPLLNPETEAFWRAATQGEFLLKRSSETGVVHWYPRALCPYTLTETEWFRSSGRGEIYSVSVTRRGVEVPYAIAYVRLDEGVTVLTNIVDCDLDLLRIGARVRVVYKASTDKASIPMFTPV